MRSIVGARAMMMLLLAGCIVLVAGCGGSSKGSSASGDTPGATSTGASTGRAPDPAATKAAFIAQADRVCGRVNAEIIAIKAKSGSAAEVKRVVPRTISISQSAISALEQMKAPASLARDWQRMIGYRRTLARELGELLAAAQSNDGTSVAPLGASKKRAHESLSKIAKANGFKDCAKVGRVG